MKATRLVSRSVGWKALAWVCGIHVALTAAAHAQVSNPLGAVLTVPINDEGQVRTLNGSLVVNTLHINSQVATLSFALPGQFTTADVQIRLPGGRELDTISSMNPVGFRVVTPGSDPTTVVVAPESGSYTPGSNGTRFYMLPLRLWAPFTARNGYPNWWHQVLLTEPMELVAYNPSTFVVLTDGATFDVQPFNTGTAALPGTAINIVTQPTLIPNLNAQPPQGPSFRLTSSGPGQVGAVWFPAKQFVAGGFMTTFQFRITGVGSLRPDVDRGGDGFAFVIQNADFGPNLPRLPGGYLGYHGIPNSLAIEFDTYFNREPGFCDPNDNHISVHTRGTAPNSVSECQDRGASLGITTAIPPMKNGALHLVQIFYQPGILSIYMDNLQAPVLVVPGLDLSRILSLDGGRAWLGFTAGTGAAFENHDIFAWNFRVLGSPF